MRCKQVRFLLLFVTVALISAACQQGTNEIDIEAGSEPTETVATEEVVEFGEVSEQDIAEARVMFEAARAHWDALEPFAYTMTTGVQTQSEIQIDFDVNGDVVDERLAQDNGYTETLPRSVEQVFDSIDTHITRFETGEREVPDEGECGDHLFVRFDAELAYPSYNDTFGPCDDGAGVFIEISPLEDEPAETEVETGEPDGIPIHGDGEPADVPVDGCDRDAFSGQWQSPRAAGTEPLDPNDGVGDEGGVGVVAIELSDSEVQVLSADTIAVYASWYCTATEIIGVTWTEDEHVIATINDEGTLSAGQWTLTKAE